MNLFFYLTAFVEVVFIPCSYGQGLVKETTNGSTALQPWLVGLTAVMVFLFVTFVATLINRIFFSQKNNDKDQMETIRSVEENVYENKAMEPEEGESDTKI